MDAFLLAVMVPTFLVSLLSESMNQALIPKLVEVRERDGKEAARQLVSGAMWVSMGILIITVLAFGTIADPLFTFVFSSFSRDKLALAVRLLYITLPVAALSGIASNCAAVLNTTGKFAFPVLIRTLTPALMIAAAFVLTRRIGITSLAVAMLLGGALEAGTMLYLLARHGYKLKLHRSAFNRTTLQVGTQYWQLLVSGLLTSSVSLADQSMTTSLAPGSLSALTYGGKCVSFLLLVLATSITTAVIPYYSEMVAKKDWHGCHDTITTYAKLTAFITVPITVLLIASSHFLIRVIFQHGAFTAADTQIVSRVQIMFAIQIPFYVLSRVFGRFLLAMRRNDLVMISGALNLTIDILLNLLLMRVMGVSGIALSTSLFAVSSFAFNAYWAYKLIERAKAETPCATAAN
jgi:putative peptidoglycan lipid II flippase